MTIPFRGNMPYGPDDPLAMAERIRRAALGLAEPSTGQPLDAYLPRGLGQDEAPRDGNYYLDQIGDASVDRSVPKPSFFGSPLGRAILGGVRGGAREIDADDPGFFASALRGMGTGMDEAEAEIERARAERRRAVSEGILNAGRLQAMQPEPAKPVAWQPGSFDEYRAAHAPYPGARSGGWQPQSLEEYRAAHGWAPQSLAEYRAAHPGATTDPGVRNEDARRRAMMARANAEMKSLIVPDPGDVLGRRRIVSDPARMERLQQVADSLPAEFGAPPPADPTNPLLRSPVPVPGSGGIPSRPRPRGAPPLSPPGMQARGAAPLPMPASGPPAAPPMPGATGTDEMDPQPNETAEAYADRVGPVLGGAEARRRWQAVHP